MPLLPGRASAAIGAALLVASWVVPAAAATTLTVGKASATSDAIIPVDVGDRLGIFKKHALELKIIDFTGGSKMAQAMAAGSLDIGDGAGTEMAFVAKGAPMIAVCAHGDHGCALGNERHLGAGAIPDIEAARGHRLRHLAAAGEIDDFQLERVLLKNAKPIADIDRDDRVRGRGSLANRQRRCGRSWNDP